MTQYCRPSWKHPFCSQLEIILQLPNYLRRLVSANNPCTVTPHIYVLSGRPWPAIVTSYTFLNAQILKETYASGRPDSFVTSLGRYYVPTSPWQVLCGHSPLTRGTRLLRLSAYRRKAPSLATLFILSPETFTWPLLATQVVNASSGIDRLVLGMQIFKTARDRDCWHPP